MSNKLLPRSYFYAFAVEGELYVWGGLTDNFKGRKLELASTINRYEQHQEVWDLLHTQGSSPPGLRNGACTSIDHYLYVYGGWDGESKYGSLHEFDVHTCTWTQLSAHTTDGPIIKYGCRMVSHGDKLVLFGGCYESGSYTNELHTFDLKEVPLGKWSSSTVSGTIPPPCSSFSFTKTDNHHVVLFGGCCSGSVRTDDVHILDLRRMHWSKLDHHEEEPWPVGRSSHAATCVGYDEDDCQLLVTGGLDDTKPLSDMWMLDMQSRKWKEITSSEMDKKPRRGHCTVAFTLSPNLTEVVMFGGTSTVASKEVFVADTDLLRFEKTPYTRKWILIDQTSHYSSTTPAAAVPQELPRHESRVIEELQERVQVAERRAREAESRLREETSQWERRLQASNEKARERLQEAQRKLREETRKLQASEERAGEAEWRLQASEERAIKAERRLQTLEERAGEAENVVPEPTFSLL